MKKTKITQEHYTPIQLKLPVDMEKIIKISDPVYSFNEVMNHIDLNKYLVLEENKTGRPRYDREKLLKIVLFAFMEYGYPSLRQIVKLCETDIRFIWILDESPTPCFNTIENFINNELKENISAIFDDINAYIFSENGVDLNHVYMDGTKLRANAGSYTLVWKKSCVKNRNKVFGKVTEILESMNKIIVLQQQAIFETMDEYEIPYPPMF